MWSFENYKAKTRFGEVHLSRILASWRNSGGPNPEYGEDNSLFEDWCRAELQISEEDARNAVEFSCNGKMELEHSAYEYLKEKGGS